MQASFSQLLGHLPKLQQGKQDTNRGSTDFWKNKKKSYNTAEKICMHLTQA